LLFSKQCHFQDLSDGPSWETLAMSVRKIPLGRRSITGAYSSVKMDRLVYHESTLERDFIYLLEFDSNVYRYEEQPMAVKYYAGRRLITHVPDFKVQYRDVADKPRSTVIFQVKYLDDLVTNWRKYHPALRATKRFARDHGWEARIVTDREIRIPRLQNVKRLLPFLLHLIDEDEASLCTELLRPSPLPFKALIRSLEEHGKEPAAMLPTIYSLIVNRRISIDFDVPIAPQTLLTLP
jgi:hypothetical protein